MSKNFISPESLPQMCRTCLRHRTPDTGFFSIFDTHPSSNELIGSLLIDCTDIDLLMDKSHSMPTAICKTCHEKLLKWYDFREEVKLTNSRILDILSNKVKPQKKTTKKAVKLKTEALDVPAEHPPFVPKIDPIVKIKIVDTSKATEVASPPLEPCVPVVKIQKVSGDSPAIRIKKVESLNKTPAEKSDVAPQVKIQKIPVTVLVDEEVADSVDDDNVEIIENIESIEIDDEEEAMECDTDINATTSAVDEDFEWPETKDVVRISAPELPSLQMAPKTFYCCQCVKNCDTRLQIRDHMRTDHSNVIAKAMRKVGSAYDDYPFSCDLCTNRYPTYSALMKHQEFFKFAKLCPICGMVVPNIKSAYEKHMKCHEQSIEPERLDPNDIEANCCMCPATFATRPELFAHAEAEHSHQINKCMVKSNDSTDPLECDVCTSKFATHTMLRNHQLRYKTAEMCPDCGEMVPIFRRATHAKNHTGRSVLRQHQCDICKKFFQSVAAIGYHMELHSTEIRLQCPHPGCEVVLRTSLRLKSHMKDHKFREFGKTLPCPEPGCGKMFFAHKPEMLARHQRIHTGQTYYSCKLCPKSFVDSTDFKRHQWQHAGVSPYMCKYCNKMHMRKNQLLAHEATCDRAAPVERLESFDTSYSLAKNRSRRSRY